MLPSERAFQIPTLFGARARADEAPLIIFQTHFYHKNFIVRTLDIFVIAPTKKHPVKKPVEKV